MKDPFVTEVRKHRMEHTKQFGADLHRICKDLRKFEATLGNRIAKPVPRPRKATKTDRNSGGT
ncbi:MAG: hypothetical protein IT367_19465 [Candidatus Hydrogenedentes bacterium]|nr:hypothetical protein [Candidatus Hydrogenedentota bacterium]